MLGSFYSGFKSLQFIVKRAARNAAAASSALDGATFVLKHEIDVRPLHLFLSSGAADQRLRAEGETLELKLMHGEVVVLREQDCALQDVAQLTYVAGP